MDDLRPPRFLYLDVVVDATTVGVLGIAFTKPLGGMAVDPAVLAGFSPSAPSARTLTAVSAQPT